jgi:hypothetical protein
MARSTRPPEKDQGDTPMLNTICKNQTDKGIKIAGVRRAQSAAHAL